MTITGLLAFGFTSCSDDDNSSGGGETPAPEATLNIVETAQSVDDLSILVDALTQAELVSTLQAIGNKTVLAPTNEAFQNFLDQKGFASLEEVPNDVLVAILLNHVIDGANISSSDLNDTGYTNTLATGAGGNSMSLFYDGTSGLVFNGISTVTTADVETTNGIVHIVDTVIDLPTIATFATSNPELSNLVATMQLADSGNNPAIDFIDTVSNETAGPFTVFAPTNAAFENLLTELGLTSLDEVGSETANDALLVHILNEINATSNDLADGPLTTLGGDITVDATAFTLTDSRDRTAGIITDLVNIQASNGIVHVIDSVLLPLAPAISTP